MKKSLVILIAATLGLAACKSEKKGAGGTLYTIYKAGGKDKIKEGDIVKVDFILRHDNDSVEFSSYDTGMAQIFPVAKKMYGGDMNDILSQFGEGDSVSFKLNADTMDHYTKQPRLESFKKDKYLNYTVVFHKVFAKKANEADSTFQKRANDFFQNDYKEVSEKKKNSEAGLIKKYIADNKLKTTTTPSGLQYVITAPGSAEKPVMGDTVMVNYTGKFTTKKSDGNDNVFDTSVESIAKKTMPQAPGATYGPRPIPLSEGVFKGFVEAALLIGKGGKITAVLPSALAYGPQGGGRIGPYSPVVFDIELVDIKKQKAGAAPVTAPVVAPKK
ncbi:FKBP-type peptidyl-prolyl cis-trans isomerase [Pedobacter sp. Hv1]|uniref:FKBP-type peptidyl-prolyl cis-trans isomerase n=1 Tax=Pedobacter sp. Hv1 TaxID=1740090 RepID=UPI0006D88F18|nr:FKBP-type peptidyl-prolyl cis-trans isomerase [Pedobacter sp. Hv1]KQC00040.1 peptidylprolyl isomerase [Pedobacter sp. Hv1]